MRADGRVFVDTNIFVYALTSGKDGRHAKARAVLDQLMREDRLCLSTQVMQEVFVTLTRKAGVSTDDALADLDDLSKWPVFTVGVAAIREAALLAKRHKISFWDALLIAAASQLGAEILYSEDLSDGQMIRGVQIANPLA